METLVAPVPMESHNHAVDNNYSDVTKTMKRPAPLAGGCRIEGFVRVKKVISIYILASFSIYCCSFIMLQSSSSLPYPIDLEKI